LPADVHENRHCPSFHGHGERFRPCPSPVDGLLYGIGWAQLLPGLRLSRWRVLFRRTASFAASSLSVSHLRDNRWSSHPHSNPDRFLLIPPAHFPLARDSCAQNLAFVISM
jgi:hypothetical protein